MGKPKLTGWQLGNKKMGECAECGQVIKHRENYIVRKEVWFQSGIGPKGGMLHQACLEKRIGRNLTDDDLLVKVVGYGKHELKMRILDLETYKEHMRELAYDK